MGAPSAVLSWLGRFTAHALRPVGRRTLDRFKFRLMNVKVPPSDFERLAVGCTEADLCNKFIWNSIRRALDEIHKIYILLHRSLMGFTFSHFFVLMIMMMWIVLGFFPYMIPNFAPLRLPHFSNNSSKILQKYLQDFSRKFATSYTQFSSQFRYKNVVEIS